MNSGTSAKKLIEIIKQESEVHLAAIECLLEFPRKDISDVSWGYRAGGKDAFACILELIEKWEEENEQRAGEIRRKSNE